MCGPVHDRPAIGDLLLMAPVAPTPAPLLEISHRWASVEIPASLPASIDLSAVSGELARIHIALCQQRMEQQLMTAAIVEALLPWYRRLWRWIQQRVR